MTEQRTTAPPGDGEAAAASELNKLEAEYRMRFGGHPPILFMPPALGIEVIREALRRDEPAPPEEWPQPGCNCAR